MATSSGPSKSDFVREVLTKNPTFTTKSVNEAWSEAGHDGKISETLVQNLRSKLGLTGNIRTGRPPADGRKTKAKAKRGRPKTGRRSPGRPKSAPSASSVAASAPAPSKAVRGGVAELEAEIDRLLFRVMDQGMPAVENALREARRQLVLGHHG